MTASKTMRKLIQYGTSVIVTLPNEFIVENGLKVGEYVEAVHSDDVVVLRAVTDKVLMNEAIEMLQEAGYPVQLADGDRP